MSSSRHHQPVGRSILIAIGMVAALAVVVRVWYPAFHHDKPAELTAALASARIAVSSPTNSRSVERIVEQMRQLHAERKYPLLSTCIVPERRDDVVSLLMAVHELLDRNVELRSLLAERLDEITADQYDFSHLSDCTGIFSRQIRIISINISDAEAAVTYQAGNLLPLRTERLVFQKNQWLLAPDAPPSGLIELVRNMSRAFGAVAAVLYKREMSPAELSREFEMRIVPLLKSIQPSDAPPALSA